MINVVDALAVDDIDEMRPDHPDEIDHEARDLELPPIDGWRTHAEWPAKNVAAAIDETRASAFARRPLQHHPTCSRSDPTFGRRRHQMRERATRAVRALPRRPESRRSV